MVIYNYDYQEEIWDNGEPLKDEYQLCSFISAELSMCTLSGRFEHCDFTSANLYRATLTGVFVSCTFTFASFVSAVLQNAIFRDCNFNMVDFEKCKGMSTCTFKDDCTFEQVKNVRFINIPGFCMTLVPDTLGTTKKPAKPPKKVESKSVSDEPIKLPEVQHYRSPQGKAKIISGSIHQTCDDYDEWGYSGLHAMAAVMGGRMHQVMHEQRALAAQQPLSTYKYVDPKTRYGYGENAVLECSDIEVYKNGRG